MKKTLLGLLMSAFLGFGVMFAQSPISAEINVKNPLTQGEAANLEITMIDGASVATSFTGSIQIMVLEEDGVTPVAGNDVTIPTLGIYTFAPTDLGTKVFQKGLEIKKIGSFYIEVSDMLDDTIYGRQLISVKRNDGLGGDYEIEVLSPDQDSIIVNSRLDIYAYASELPNSTVSILIDDEVVGRTYTNQNGEINYSVPNITPGGHALTIEISDIEGNILGKSDVVDFSCVPSDIEGFKEITVEPEIFTIGDVAYITVYTDEMAEAVKLYLSDRDESEGIIMKKDENGAFSQTVFLNTAGDINISLDISLSNNSITQRYDNVTSIFVSETPEITNVRVETDWQKKEAVIYWDPAGDGISYLVNYGLDENDLSMQELTNTESFMFTDVPYDTTVYLQITPYQDDMGHGAGTTSKTIKFIITKPEEVDPSSANLNGLQQEQKLDTPRCTIQNITTHTEKIGDSYYLIWDKVENVSKYIVYSSPTPEVSNRTKVYETSDTSYEYPFDHTSKEDVFMYFWIEGICDDGEELQLTGATKVQVGPAQNFFLLICLTFLIYFGIKIFRQTEE